MPKLDKIAASNWKKNTEALILKLNETVGNEFTGEGFYQLVFRGKNHRPMLMLDGLVVAVGIFNINMKLHNTCVYYHII